MNHQKHYNSLINRAKSRILKGYSENHHIVPKCMNGSNDSSNLARLTAEEHYVAHQLLVKIYPGNGKLVCAAKMMTVINQSQKRNNKLYGWLKKRRSEVMSGKKLSEETKRKMSKAHSGKFFSEETRKKLSIALSGKKRSEEHKRKLSKALSGKNHPNYGKFGKNNPNFGKKHSEESRKKMSKAHSGKNHHMYGKTHSKETKKKMGTPIVCLNTNKKYDSLTQAAKDLNLHRQSIGQVLRGRSKATGGYNFKYVKSC